ncbi:hypothetical protein [Halosimplex halophilum]|uniref:hypothetical protein n=1 Tax=Halosimplex halophilum TaxID=2559572 RepID=UPI00107FB859|nr:hypothetical protein [Halosimplex halophilum]
MGPRRSLLVLLALTAALAGCSAVGGEPAGTVPGANCTTDAVAAYDADLRLGNRTAQPYPDAPSTVNESTVAAFAARFETAHTTNEFLHEHADSGAEFHSVDVETTITDTERRSDGYRIALRTGVHYSTDAGIGTNERTAEYYVNETAILRSYDDDADPRNGTVLARC